MAVRKALRKDITCLNYYVDLALRYEFMKEKERRSQLAGMIFSQQDAISRIPNLNFYTESLRRRDPQMFVLTSAGVLEI
jgi:hypothetical protein